MGSEVDLEVRNRALRRGMKGSIGIEGFGLVDNRHVLVADEAEIMAGSIARVLRDRRLWQRLRRAGRQHINQNNDVETARSSL